MGQKDGTLVSASLCIPIIQRNILSHFYLGEKLSRFAQQQQAPTKTPSAYVMIKTEILDEPDSLLGIFYLTSLDI